MGQIITKVTKKPLLDKLATKESQRDWLRFNDVEMVPDRGFVKQLKALCATLEVVWNAAAAVWEIWDFPESGLEPYMVTKVQSKDKTYRELGVDVLLKLQESIFFTNHFSAKQICDYLEEMENQIRRRKEKEFRDKMTAVAQDTFLWSMGVLQVQVPRSLTIERSLNHAG